MAQFQAFGKAHSFTVIALVVLSNILSAVAKLSCFFISDLSFFQSSKKLKCSGFPVISISKVGIKSNGLFIGGKRFFIAPIVKTENVPTTSVGSRIVRVKLNRPFISLESTLEVPKTKEGIPLSLVGSCILRIKSNGFL